MRASVKPIKAPKTPYAVKKMIEQNSRSLERMMLRLAAGQFFVDARRNLIPRQGTQKGTPLRRSHKSRTTPIFPCRYNTTTQTRTGCTQLQAVDYVILLGR